MTTSWKLGFPVAGPAAWNNLSTHVQASETLTMFKSHLKTRLLYLTITELMQLLHI